jgi:putative nucleotidyltransferase with HDIG domain
MPDSTPLPPDRMASWLASVDADALRALDEQLLLYLLVNEDDPSQKRDVAGIVANYLRTAETDTIRRFHSLFRALGQPIPSATPETGFAGLESEARQRHAAPRDSVRRDEHTAGGFAAMGEHYSCAVSAADDLWQSAATEGMPDLGIAREAIEELAEAVTRNRPGMLAFTALSPSGEYTFTHMVNVAILTLALARTLNIDGRLLRDLGLAAMMHDIGKVQTPPEILNKPERLTKAEFRIMERHTVDGAEMLRRTPGMPTLAPIVAFEHHLRIDGSGYPAGARRHTLNLGTMMCSIADVYDAMRSHRTYQPSFGSDRILHVLQRSNEGPQFDANLVQRFAHLMGIPPGGLKEPWPAPND